MKYKGIRGLWIVLVLLPFLASVTALVVPAAEKSTTVTEDVTILREDARREKHLERAFEYLNSLSGNELLVLCETLCRQKNEEAVAYLMYPEFEKQLGRKIQVKVILQHILDRSKDENYRAFLTDFLEFVRQKISLEDKQLTIGILRQIVVDRGDTPQTRSVAMHAMTSFVFDLRKAGVITTHDFAEYCKLVLSVVEDHSNNTEVRRCAAKMLGKYELDHREAIPRLLRTLEYLVSNDEIVVARAVVVELGVFTATSAVPLMNDILRTTRSRELYGSTAYALGFMRNYDALTALIVNARRFGSYSCDDALNRNRNLIVDALKSDDDERLKLGLLGSQYLTQQELLVTHILYLLKREDVEIRRLVLERLLCIADKKTLERAIKMLRNESNPTILSKLEELRRRLQATPLQGEKSDIRVFELSIANTETQEVADAMYRELPWIPYPDYNHAALYHGLNQQVEQKTIEALGRNKKVQFCDLSGMKNNPGKEYFGAYNLNNVVLSFNERQSIVRKGRELIWADIYYPWQIPPYALIYKPGTVGPISVSEIDRIRCDGVTEYCYERCGFDVWGAYGNHYDISHDTIWCNKHNDRPDYTQNPEFELSPKAQRGAYGNTNTHMVWAAITEPPTYAVETTSVPGGIEVSVTATDYGSGIFYIGITMDAGTTWYVSPFQQNYPSSPSQRYTCPELVTTSQWVYYYAMDNGGNLAEFAEGVWVEVGIEEMFMSDIAPETYVLHQNTPNPVYNRTTVSFSVPADVHAVIRIYDTTGRLVSTLVDGMAAAGRHSIRWDGKGRSGEKLAPGIYFYRMKAGDFVSTRKMVLLR